MWPAVISLSLYGIGIDTNIEVIVASVTKLTTAPGL